MAKKPKAKPDDPAQSKRFEETARALDADVGGDAFERAMSILSPSPKEEGVPQGTPARGRKLGERGTR